MVISWAKQKSDIDDKKIDDKIDDNWIDCKKIDDDKSIARKKIEDKINKKYTKDMLNNRRSLKIDYKKILNCIGRSWITQTCIFIHNGAP